VCGPTTLFCLIFWVLTLKVSHPEKLLSFTQIGTIDHSSRGLKSDVCFRKIALEQRGKPQTEAVLNSENAV
jgi:hypothetical protein